MTIKSKVNYKINKLINVVTKTLKNSSKKVKLH